MKIESILKLVSETFGVPEAAILSERREEYIVIARHTAMYFAREYTNLTLQQIAHEFYRRDHATVLNAVTSIEGKIYQDEELAYKVGMIRITLVSTAISEKSKVNRPVLRPWLAARLSL